MHIDFRKYNQNRQYPIIIGKKLPSVCDLVWSLVIMYNVIWPAFPVKLEKSTLLINVLFKYVKKCILF